MLRSQGPFFSAPGLFNHPICPTHLLFEMAQSDRRSKLEAQIAIQDREQTLKQAITHFKKFHNVARAAREAGISRDLLRG